MKASQPLIAAGVAMATAVVLAQTDRPTDWVDPSTGHRIVRLTDEAGGSTLYFHDNAFSPEGDTLMFNTPAGIAVMPVAAIGTPGAKAEVVAPNARGGYFARRSREIYFSAGRGGAGGRGTGGPGGGRGGGVLRAVHVDTKRVRDVTHARGLVICPETILDATPITCWKRCTHAHAPCRRAREPGVRGAHEGAVTAEGRWLGDAASDAGFREAFRESLSG